MEVHVHHELEDRPRKLLQPSRRAGKLFAASVALVTTLLVAASALALTVDVTRTGPSVVGEEHLFTAVVTDATEPVTYEWRFGDAGDFEAGGAEMSHTFEAPGLYNIDVTATDAGGYSASWFFRHLVHHPLTPLRPTSSTSIVYDEVRNRIYCVNQDNDSVTAIDPDNLVKLGELEVYRKPESLALTPDGKLWVVHQDDYAVAVIDPDRFVIDHGFRLPYASQPVAVAMSPTGDAAYISLMAVGKLLKLDPVSDAVLGELDVGPRPRGIAVSHDGRDVYVTRFISSDAGGEVVKVDAAAMTVATRILLRLDTETVDSDQRARGVPNYLFSVGITPDGRQAWVPGKKDNILRGRLRDGQEITHDTTVRPLAAAIDTQTAQEIYESRIDLDDRSMPVHVTFSPYGNLAILTLAGSNRVELRDINLPTQVFSAIGDVGSFPRAAVLAPNERLFVQAMLSREVLAYDMSLSLDDFDQSTPALLGAIPTVESEKLSPEVLLGKKIFHNADDTRMAFEGYLSCGGCHFEGIDDGRVYDFSTRGEGLRNTVSLLGRRGMGQGRLNWGATLDEVQDFEHQIRDLFNGTGFIPDEVLEVGTRAQPLGDPKAGLSPELDALSAYVTSLDHVNPSPYRNADGSLTPDGAAGKVVFEKLGCQVCHGGPELTDSARGELHDVGTITALSGTRAGGPLFGIDTPSLLGVWETAPYLHDGSAATLRDVFTTRNPTDLHGYTSSLSPEELDDLVAYLLQIDSELAVHAFPFDPPFTPPPEASGGMASGGAPSESGQGGSTSTPADETASREPGGLGCSLSGGRGAAAPGAGWLLCLLGLVWSTRRGRASRVRAMVAAVLALAVTGCGPAEAEGEAGSEQATDWASLPAVTTPDPELSPLGTRQETFDRVCARGRGDSVARALCGSGQRPEIGALDALLELVGLAENRAFALTGNSTSLVSRSVSAINPRLIVFPRVEFDLSQPASMTAVGFVRGEQFVELVSRDLGTGDLNFYLLNFEQSCNYAGGGCDLPSRLTEEIEHDWTAYSIYDQDDLESTSFDCLSCHLPGGQGTRRILRMQELTSPWMHWFPQRFGQRTESDRVLLAQFAETHQSDQQYGGIPIATIVNALDEGSGAQLEALVRAEGFDQQPNPFDGQIAAELKTGKSSTWETRFEAHLRGEAIAVPYPAIDVTDQVRRTAATSAYLAVVQGGAPRESLLDLREVFSEDATQKLGFVPQPGADGRTILLEMCARCHDGRGNPELPKNRFDVLRLNEMSRTEKDLAITRINATGVTQMPPWRVGRLTPESIQAATLELQK